MSPPRTVPAAEQAWLYREAEHLTEAFCARLREDGDADTDSPEFIRRRDELLAQIEALGGPLQAAGCDADELEQYARESAAAVRRMIDLNAELVELLEARRTQVRKQLAEVGRCRKSLASYRGPAPTSPVFFDRVG